ncbi:MAG: enoyl-CoA hydratase, partial [Pseudomonadota bacterium]
MAYETIVVDTDDKVATIRLNRPDQMNALSVQMLGELAA